MSIEARQIQKTLYSYAAILNFTPSPQGLRAKFGACSVQNAQLLTLIPFHFPSICEQSALTVKASGLLRCFTKIRTTLSTYRRLSMR